MVDDEEIVIDVAGEFLKKLGDTVLEAKNGNEAISIFNQNNDKIDMVILDIIIPNMNGGETYDKLKEINPKIKFLLSSGDSINGQAT